MGNKSKKHAKKKKAVKPVTQPQASTLAPPKATMSPRTREDSLTFSSPNPNENPWTFEVPVHIRWRERRSIKLTMSPSRELHMEVPLEACDAVINDFLREHSTWIWEQIHALAKATVLPVLTPEQEYAMREMLRIQAIFFYKRPIAGWNSKLRPKKIRIARQKTRWGSCSSSGTISLNVYLMLLPAELREYVFMHELCHMKHPHHQAEFWEALAEMCPDYQNLRRSLKDYRIPDYN